MPEVDRRARVVRRFEFHAEGFVPIRVDCGQEARGPRRFVAAAIDRATLARLVVLPDGRRAAAAGARMTAFARAVLAPVDPRDLAIRVRVELDGFAPLEFDHFPVRPFAPRSLAPVAR